MTATTEPVRGWIVVDKTTGALDWDGELHPSEEAARESLNSNGRFNDPDWKPFELYDVLRVLDGRQEAIVETHWVAGALRLLTEPERPNAVQQPNREALIEAIAKEIASEFMRVEDWGTASDSIKKGVRAYVERCVVPLLAVPATGEARKPEAAPSDTDREALLKIVDPFLDEAIGEYGSGARNDRGLVAAIQAAGFSRSQPVQVEPEALAAKLYSIEYQVDPDSATPDDVDERLGAADELIAWFAEHT